MELDRTHCPWCFVLAGTQHSETCPRARPEEGEHRVEKVERIGPEAAEQKIEPCGFTNGYEIRHREAARVVAAAASEPDSEEAERRRVLAQALATARRIRVLLYDNTTHYDMIITMPWPDYMAQCLHWRGIMFDHGWIPLRSIKLIAPLAADGQQLKFEGNVVPMKRPT